MTTADTTISSLAGIIDPLCDETARLFKPIALKPYDVLKIELTPDGDEFDCVASIDKIKAMQFASMKGRSYPPESPSPAARTAWANRVPEKRGIGYGRWVCKATDFTAIIISALWPRHQLRMTPDARAVFDFLVARFNVQFNASKMRAAFKVEGSVPSDPNGFIDHPSLELSRYQRVGVFGSLYQECSALFMDRGTGKTACVISRVMNEARRMKIETKKKGEDRGPYRALIVVPKNVRYNWKTEIERFCTTPGQITILRGGKLERVKLLVEAMTPVDDDVEWTVVIASYDSIGRTWDAFKIMHWDLAVLDESHYIKGWYADRQKRLLKYRDNCEQRMILTGSPIGNSILDLWGQLEFLGDGMSGFSSWKEFRRYYCRFDNQQGKSGGPRRVIGFQNLPMLHERLSRLCFMISKREALPDLPEQTYDAREVAMTATQAEYYEQLEQQLAIEIEADLERAEREDGGKQLTVNNILVKLLRLAQITSGYVTWNEVVSDDGEVLQPRTIESLEPNPKVEALVEILKEKNGGQKTIVWACFEHDLLRIKDALEQAGIESMLFYGKTSDEDRDLAEKRFNNDPTVKVFIGNPSAGGVGLNLRGYNPDDPECETNCDHVIYYSQNWSSLVRGQSEDRAHRRGTRTSVQYTDLVVPGTIDEEIRARVLQKQVDAMEIQDIRGILRRILEARPVVEND